MKIISVFLFFPMLLQIGTCNPTCNCGRQCYYYNGSTEICQTPNTGAQQFAKSVDSLNQLYGNGNPYLTDSVTVTGSSNNAVNSITNQLEKQGYTCTCSD